MATKTEELSPDLAKLQLWLQFLWKLALLVSLCATGGGAAVTIVSDLIMRVA